MRGVVALRRSVCISMNAARLGMPLMSSGGNHEPIPDAAIWLTIQRQIGQISHLVSQVNTLSEIGEYSSRILGGKRNCRGNGNRQRYCLRLPFSQPGIPYLRDRRPLCFEPLLAILIRLLLVLLARMDAGLPPHQLIKHSGSGMLFSGARRFSLIGNAGEVTDCAFSPDGRLIVTSSADQTLRVWDSGSGKERLSLVGHTEKVNACAFSPDSHWIVSASDDKMLRVWDATSGDSALLSHRSCR